MIFSFARPALAGTLCSDQENFYGIEIPEGFGADLQQAQKQKQCLLLYPLGSSLKLSAHTLKIGWAPLKHDQPLKDLITKDLAAVLKKNKKARVELEAEITSPENLTFQFRRLFDTKPAPFYVGFAYHQSLNQALVITSTIPKEDDLPLYETVYKTFILKIKKLEAKDIFSYLKDQSAKDLNAPTAHNFNLRFINSIRGSYLEAVKACTGQPSQGLGIVRISEDGKIQDWYDEKSSEKISCLGKKMKGVQGTKAPFEPFHILINSVSF